MAARAGAQAERELPLLSQKLGATLDSLNAASSQAREVLGQAPELMRGSGELVRDTQAHPGCAPPGCCATISSLRKCARCRWTASSRTASDETSGPALHRGRDRVFGAAQAEHRGAPGGSARGEPQGRGAYVRHGELENAARLSGSAPLFASPRGCRGHRGQRDQSLHRAPATGRFADARASLAAVLDQRNKFSNARLAEVSCATLLDLDEKNLAGADDWMAKATGHCAERCPAGAAIHNVRAQLALQAGRTDAAFLAARSAHDASRALGDQAEQANALRLLGIVGLKNGDAASARQHLEAGARDRPRARRAAQDRARLARPRPGGGAGR